ncbi:MAG: cation transporter [Fimbriimonadaceae bacterium]|nr:cation transporter [Alphaproteobacteria bacterium]
MAGKCCGSDVKFDGMSPTYKRILWIVIALNATMFAVEIIAGHTSGSKALQADALDFLGDTITYGISMIAIGQSLIWRARTALAKGVSLAVMGTWVLGSTMYNVIYPGIPEAMTMGIVGFLALAANVASVALLYGFRDGDANIRSVWLCSRNDAIGNVAVMLAASGVWATTTGWPDLAVALLMASLFLYGSFQIIRQARAELKSPRPAASGQAVS